MGIANISFKTDLLHSTSCIVFASFFLFSLLFIFIFIYFFEYNEEHGNVIGTVLNTIRKITHERLRKLNDKIMKGLRSFDNALRDARRDHSPTVAFPTGDIIENQKRSA